MLPDNPSGNSYVRHIIESTVDFLANYFPFFIVLIIGIGFSAAFYVNRLDYAVRGSIIGIPALLAAYSIVKIRTKEKFDGTINLLTLNTFIVTSLFITLYLFSISSVIISSTRPWYYFILIACLFCVVGIQIFSRNPKPNLILLEIIGLIMNLSYSVVLKYPLYFGWTDTLYLIGIAKVTLLSGYVIPPDLIGSYTNFPLYHIYLAEIAALLGLDIQTVLFSVMIIPYAVITLFIFKLFFLVSKNKQLSLLVCLIYAGLPVIIFYGTYIQTRVMAYFGFIVLLYVFFKGADPGRNALSYRIVFFLALAYMILVHQVSMTQIIPLLFVLFVIEWVISDKKVIRLDLIATIFVLTFSYWIYGAYDFFHEAFARLNIFSSKDLLMVKSSIEVANQWDFIFYNSETAILVFFILCGIGYLLYTERKNYLAVFALFGLVMLPFFVPNPLQMLWTSMVIFRADRMMLLLAPFFAFLMGVGIYVHVPFLKNRNISNKVCCCLLIIIIFFFSLLSMTLTNASDSKDIFWATQKNYFDQGELRGLQHVINYIPLNSTLASDYNINRYFGIDRFFSKSDEIQVPYYKIGNFNYTGPTITGRGYFIIRQKELLNKGLAFETAVEGNTELLTYSNDTRKKMTALFASTNRLYDNTNIIITKFP